MLYIKFVFVYVIFHPRNESFCSCFSTDPKEWENLFPELVRVVADDLLRSDVTEYIRLRAVCNPWRSATAAGDPRLMEPRFFPRNWQLLRGNMLGEQARFVNVLFFCSNHDFISGFIC